MKNCKYCGKGMVDEETSCPGCGAPQEVKQSPKAAPVKDISNSSLYEYSNMGLFKITIFPNRISILDKRGGLPAMMSPKKTDILIKNITGINIKGFLKHLELTMNDGSCREIPLIMGKDSEKMRDVLVGLL
ncbi:MAG: hypothetical protein C3F13_07205 [Anaerolineales bacterium]|nr:hypothetical protein [Anaerolineae bacterium]PWB54072.1 MAG: hypothetical protein C3F13_07205 [Anaerolineales bacterium]